MLGESRPVKFNRSSWKITSLANRKRRSVDVWSNESQLLPRKRRAAVLQNDLKACRDHQPLLSFSCDRVGPPVEDRDIRPLGLTAP